MDPAKVVAAQKALKNLPQPPATVKTEEQYWDWVAHQSRSVRDQITATRIAAMGGGDHAHHQVNANLSKAQTAALAKGDKLPDTNPTTGEGISFKSESDRAAWQKNRSTEESAGIRDQAKALDASAFTVTPTLDKGYAPAFHPEQGAHYEGAAGDEQVAALLGKDQVRSDTEGLRAQQAGLDQYGQIIDAGGLTAIDKASIEQARQKRDAEARAGALAAEQKAEMMGRAGSAGSRLLAQTAASNATNQQALQNLQTNALALQRKDTAIGARAALGGQIQTAQDAIDRFNTEGERARRQAVFNAQNAANKDKYTEQNARDERNTSTYNDFYGRGLAYGAGLSSLNTDRSNRAEEINKGPTGGARGAVGLDLTAQDPVNAARSATANDAIQKERDAAARAEQEAALGVNAASAGTGYIVNALTPRPR